jgi:aspartate racemase
VVKAAESANLRNIGILGTKFLMEGPVYPEILTKHKIGFRIPTREERQRINEIIFGELVYGSILPGSKAYFHKVINEFRKAGCDSVILGCTEIPLIVLPPESPLPVLDSTRILARAALSHSVNSL